jgi:hypothetical protein
MKVKGSWLRGIYITGVIALVLGAFDPMEGSIVIATGAMLLTVATYQWHDKYRKAFLVSFIFIAIGVFALFYLSSLGGFGGNSTVSWWWGLLIVPYPIGWLAAVVVFIIRYVKNRKVVVNRF